jgi:hypothetical protein
MGLWWLEKFSTKIFRPDVRGCCFVNAAGVQPKRENLTLRTL